MPFRQGTLLPTGLTSQALHYSFEKAGLTLDNQPIPWNAEAVLVEALVTLPQITSEARKDFVLSGPEGLRVVAEAVRPGTTTGQARVFFRLPVPTQTILAEVRWRDATLGQITLPLLTQTDFAKSLKLVEPTIHVRLGEQMPACLAYVTGQAKELIASALVTAPSSLVPLADLEFAVELVNDRDEVENRHVIQFGSGQLSARQAQVVARLPKPRGSKAWHVRWAVAGNVIARRRIQALSRLAFLKSLRISTTRYFLEGAEGLLPLARMAPESLAGITRLGPIFLIASGIAGMAAMADFEVRVISRSGTTLMAMAAPGLLVSDGPTVVAPGTLGQADLGQIAAFEIWAEGHRVGSIALGPAPIAQFNTEGGFAAPVADVPWSPIAEEQLRQRLGSLLGS